MKIEKNGKNNKRAQNLGFSLIEAMVVIAVMAIVIAVAVPLMVGTFGRANSEIYLDKVKAALELGRITAMSESVSVFLCPAYPLPTCDTFPATNCCDTSVSDGNWGENRLLLFTSSTGSSSSATRLITSIEAPASGEYLSSTNAGVKSIEFQPSGLSSTMTSLRYCATVDGQGAGRFKREVVMNIIGRVRLDIHDDSQVCS